MTERQEGCGTEGRVLERGKWTLGLAVEIWPESRAGDEAQLARWREDDLRWQWNTIAEAASIPGFASGPFAERLRSITGKLPPEGVAAALHEFACAAGNEEPLPEGLALLEMLDGPEALEAWRRKAAELEAERRRQEEQKKMGECPF